MDNPYPGDERNDGNSWVSFCPACPIGRYQDEVGQASCKACPMGRYEDRRNSTKCLNCPAGSYGDTTGNDEIDDCIVCGVGTYSLGGTSNCTLCPGGTYLAELGIDITRHDNISDCDGCSAGKLSSDDRSACDVCSPGTEPDNDEGVCVDCTTGYYSSSGIECLACGAGFYTGKENQATSCGSCDAGRYSAELSVNCSDCSAGEYSSARASECIECETGSYTITTGSSACNKCDAGKFANITGSKSCHDCPRGYFVGTTGASECLSCVEGSYSSHLASVQCTDCDAGKSQSDQASTACDDCSSGYFTSSTGQSACLPCEAGTYALSGAASCSKCEAGTYSNATASECLVCPAGYYSLSGAAVCTGCDPGKFSDNTTGFDACTSCNAGKYSQTAQSECSTCPSGTYSFTGAILCTDCDPGRYSDSETGFDTCTVCNAGTFSRFEASKCTTCEPGKYSFTGSGICSPCDAGKYTDNTTGFAACASCGAGTYSLSKAGECTMCEAGKFSSVAASECSTCDAGKYANNETGFSACTSCDSGTYSESGAQSCASCAAGKYSSTGAGACTACDAGKHSNSDTGFDTCKSCSAGYWSSVSAEDCSTCEAGTFSSVAASDCSSCEPGKYSDNTTGFDACTSCDAGTYSLGGSGSCISCINGRYSFTGASGCLGCEAGKYSNNVTGFSTCTSCSAGYWSNQSATSCEMCDNGKYSSYTGASECVLCEAGKFSNTETGFSSCDKCSSSSDYGAEYTSLEGSDVCNVCVAGYYWDEVDSCVSCPNGVNCNDQGATLFSLEVQSYHYRFTPASTLLYECETATCRGGNVSGSYCTLGATGPLCALCEDDYYMSSALEEGRCLECGPNAWLTPTITLGCLLLFIVAIVILKSVYKDKIDAYKVRLEAWARKNEETLTATLVQLAVFAVTVQTVMLLSSNHSAAGGSGLPPVYTDFVVSFEIMSFNIFAVLPATGCINLFGSSFVMSLITQTGCMFLFTMTCIVLWLRRSRKDRLWYRRRGAKQIQGPSAYKHLRHLVHVGKLLLPAVSRTIAQTFKCVSYDDVEPQAYLLVDHSIDCNSSYYSLLAAYSALMVIIFPIGFPLATFIGLYTIRRHLQVDLAKKPAEEADESRRSNLSESHTLHGHARPRKSMGSGRRQSMAPGRQSIAPGMAVSRASTTSITSADLEEERDVTEEMLWSRYIKRNRALRMSPFKPVFRDYKPKYSWWYEVLDIMRRLALTCGTLTFNRLSEFILFSIFTCVVALVLHQEMQPYISPELNAVCSIEQWQNMMTVIALLLKDAEMFDNDGSGISYRTVGIVLLVTNLSMVLIIGVPWLVMAFKYTRQYAVQYAHEYYYGTPYKTKEELAKEQEEEEARILAQNIEFGVGLGHRRRRDVQHELVSFSANPLFQGQIEMADMAPKTEVAFMVDGAVVVDEPRNLQKRTIASWADNLNPFQRKANKPPSATAEPSNKLSMLTRFPGQKITASSIKDDGEIEPSTSNPMIYEAAGEDVAGEVTLCQDTVEELGSESERGSYLEEVALDDIYSAEAEHELEVLECSMGRTLASKAAEAEAEEAEADEPEFAPLSASVQTLPPVRLAQLSRGSRVPVAGVNPMVMGELHQRLSLMSTVKHETIARQQHSGRSSPTFDEAYSNRRNSTFQMSNPMFGAVRVGRDEHRLQQNTVHFSGSNPMHATGGGGAGSPFLQTSFEPVAEAEEHPSHTGGPLGVLDFGESSEVGSSASEGGGAVELDGFCEESDSEMSHVSDGAGGGPLVEARIVEVLDDVQPVDTVVSDVGSLSDVEETSSGEEAEDETQLVDVGAVMTPEEAEPTGTVVSDVGSSPDVEEASSGEEEEEEVHVSML